MSSRTIGLSLFGAVFAAFASLADENAGFLTGKVSVIEPEALVALGLGVSEEAEERDPSDPESPGYVRFILRASDLFADLIQRKTVEVHFGIVRDDRIVAALPWTNDVEQTWRVACGFGLRLTLASRITYQWMEEGTMYWVDLDSRSECAER